LNPPTPLSRPAAHPTDYQRLSLVLEKTIWRFGDSAGSRNNSFGVQLFQRMSIWWYSFILRFIPLTSSIGLEFTVVTASHPRSRRVCVCANPHMCACRCARAHYSVCILSHVPILSPIQAHSTAHQTELLQYRAHLTKYRARFMRVGTVGA